jgi:hypothetical protein
MKTKVKDFLADLITEERWSATVLERLLTSPAASWHTVSDLCAGIKDATKTYHALTEGMEQELVATWLPHPVGGPDACLVLFYDDEGMTSSVAVLNRARHLELLRDRCSSGRNSRAAS